jgi:hypothetical protein
MSSKYMVLLLGVATGCTDYEVKSTSDANSDLSGDGVPDIAVNPSTINFPNLDAAAGLEATEIVVVTNQGTADLHISDIYINDDASPFNVNVISSPLIPPGGEAQFTVTFSPDTAADNLGLVYIDSDDPDLPTAQVELNGVGVAPVIEITPNTYDFGTLYIGCEQEQGLSIKNTGSADLIVSNFSFSTASTDMNFDSVEAENGPMPWTISPMSSIEVFVDYSPMDEVGDEAFLTVTSNDPYTPDVLVTQEGMGEIFLENQDEYEQPIKGATDIIFAVDRSCSMDDDIQSVQDNFGTFVNTLSTMDADYHVAATVEDNGCINGPDLYIDNTFSSTDASTSITTMINLGGSYGSNTEMAFMLLESCLAESLSASGCNYGLIRDEATLALVGVSDEVEQSINDWAYYVSLFQGLKNDPDDVIIHAIGGDYPGGCGGNDPYTGMYEATVATGGLFLSICATDWGAHLEALAEGSAADLSSFGLSDYPVPETIVVKVNGLTTTVGWEYSDSSNSVDFDQDHIPEGGSTIEIDYAVYGSCEQ